MDSYMQWKQQLNGQPLANTLFNDPFKDGYSVAPWTRVPQAMYTEAFLRGRGTTSLQSNDNWSFPENDRGAVSFRVSNSPDQLLIDLGGPNSDAFGYSVVIGRGGYSGVMRKSIQGTMLNPWNPDPDYTFHPIQNVQYDSRFYLPDTPVDLWISYNYGRIEVGTGAQPGSGHVILKAFDPQAAPGIQLVGFGVWTNSDDRASTVSHITAWKFNGSVKPWQAPPYFTLLNYP